MSLDLVYNHRPSSIAEMALYPLLRSALERLYEKGHKHLLFYGGTGTGKTTAARILAHRLDKTFLEFDCSVNNSREDFLKLVETITLGGTGLKRLFHNPNKHRCIILDEFHDLPHSIQNLWKKTLEEKTFRENATCILCVNALDDIVPPIISRCQEKLPFDTGYIKGGKFVPNPAAKITKTEWTQEIFRAVRIVADKASIEVDDKTLKYIADDSVSLVDMREFLSAVEAKI